MAAEKEFLPALRFKALTPLFDSIVRFGTRERAFKTALLDQASVAPGETALDLGCGTGTLAVELAARTPGARVIGLDADPKILEQARAKARKAGADGVEFVESFSDSLPLEDASVDVVLSTLFFHHLQRPTKVATLAEIVRVLRPGGRLHVADWGKPSDRFMAAVFAVSVRALDGFAVTADNARGLLPRLFAEAGLENARQDRAFRTPGGTLALYSASR